MIKMIRLIFLVLVIIVHSSASEAQPSIVPAPASVVVELFTSQGDINSPEADLLLSEIIAEAKKNNKQVYGIALHVDFWNRYGWKDPFSSFRYTNRLNNYSTAFREKETYTPRFLVNGKPVGESPTKKSVSELINKELSSKSQYHPEFEFQIFNDTLDVSYDLKGAVKMSRRGSAQYINIVIVESGLTTKVTSGDNTGKTLQNDCVSRLFYTTNLQGSKGLLRVPLRGLKPGQNKDVLLFTQDKQSRVITGSASKPFIRK